jgi:hypothetical protein
LFLLEIAPTAIPATLLFKSRVRMSPDLCIPAQVG